MNTKLFKLIYTFFGKIPYKLLVICTILLCINLCCKLYEHEFCYLLKTLLLLNTGKYNIVYKN